MLNGVYLWLFLFIITIWSSSTAWQNILVFQIKISISKPFMNSTFSYGTIFINGAYLFCCLYNIFSEIKASNDKIAFHFSYIFTFSIKTFKIDTNHRKMNWNLTLQIICQKFQSPSKWNRLSICYLLKNSIIFYSYSQSLTHTHIIIYIYIVYEKLGNPYG